MQKSVETFFSAWGMSDADARQAAIAKAMTSNASYADPRSPDILNGIDAIAEYVAMFSANAPGWEATVVKTSETAGMMRATVAFGGMGPDGKKMVQNGQYFAEFSDGKISRMVGFVGMGEAD